MRRKIPEVGSAEELIYKIDSLLEDNADLSSDSRVGSLIALSFCDLLRASLNDTQKEAVEVARSYWDGSDSRDRDGWLLKFTDIVEHDTREGTEQRKAGTNRLVRWALSGNTPFSGYAAEFLMFFGGNAGLSVQEMRGVFGKFIPGIKS